MQRTRIRSTSNVSSMKISRATVVATLAAFAVTATAIACAQADSAPEGSDLDGPGSEVPEAGVKDADALPDAECETSDSSRCTTTPDPCESVDWCPVQTPADPRRAFTSVWGTSKDDVWAVGSAGTVLHFDGAAWTTPSVETTRTLSSVGGSGPDDVWIVGTYGTVYHGPGFDGGTANWQSVPIVPYTGAPEKLLSAVWSASPDDIWITGESLRIPGLPRAATQYRKKSFVDGGLGWDAISPCASCGFMGSVWAASASDVWSVGEGGRTFHTTQARLADGGVGGGGDAAAPGWFAVDSRSTQDLLAVWGSSNDDVWTVGRRGTIRHWVAGASAWEIVATGTTEDLRGIWGSSKDDIWVVGEYGTILHFDGTTWQSSKAAFPVGIKPHLYGVWGSAKNDVWVVGVGIVLHFTGAKN